MCGIAGFIDSSLGMDARHSLLDQMLEKIAHRGPDARGTWYKDETSLGHNRLSIIDLSEDGNQPMHYEEASIVFNGEIYNYLEIKKELIEKGYSFHTHSDTEVILAAYKAWGVSCVDRFVGMWAFALWDAEKKELFCSRDRFGIKPFYYIYENGKFYFGSEYKALKVSPLFRNDLNLNQVARGLQLGWNAYHDETYFNVIKALPAAHNIIIKHHSISISRYWDINTEQSLTLNADEAAEQFRLLFMESVSIHMRSDVEVGGCLSGGLDSSAIAGATAVLYPEKKLKTFTIYYEGKNEVDERPWVKEVVKKYPSIEPYYYTPTDHEIHDSFERAIYHADVPLAGSSPISQYFLMQLASKLGVKVVLDGQGSDEFLGGYLHSFYRLIGGRLRQGNLISGLNELKAHKMMQNFSAGKSIDLLLKSALTGLKSEEALYSLEYYKYLPFLPKSPQLPLHLKDVNGSRLNQFLYHLTTTTSLPTLLQFEDRNSMAFSIESRVPFLDHRIVEFAFSLGDHHKIEKGVTKKILREGLNGILPDAIANRKDKKGFVTPGEVKWLRGPLSFLLDQDFKDLDFLNQKRVIELINRFKQGDNKHANLVWRLAVLKYWMK